MQKHFKKEILKSIESVSRNFREVYELIEIFSYKGYINDLSEHNLCLLNRLCDLIEEYKINKDDIEIIRSFIKERNIH